jgi:hypothetical protein
MDDKKKFRMMSSDIIAELEQIGAYVFGGYVRDVYSDLQFKDIDIFLNNSLAVVDAIHMLEASEYKVADVSNGKSLHFYGLTDLEKYSYSVTNPRNGMQVNIDLVKSLSRVINSPFRRGKDADINFLELHQGVATVAPCLREFTTFDEVVEHIRDGVFVADSTVSPRRIQKMLDLGFKPLNGVQTSILAPSCEKCNGTGVLDFEFYKRDCDCKLK